MVSRFGGSSRSLFELHAFMLRNQAIEEKILHAITKQRKTELHALESVQVRAKDIRSSD